MKYRYLVSIKVLVHLACLVPLGRLGYLWYTDDLGANPIELITRSTGFWTLVLLMVTLGVTPLRRLTRQPWLIRLRRLVGLYAFFYACLHFTTYIWLDKEFEVAEMVKDVFKRPFITAGFSSFLLLVPLALTSNKVALRLLTGRRWQLLHRLVYLSAVAGVVHFWWLVKADITQPLIFAGVLAILLGCRLALKLWSLKPSRAGVKSPSAATTD